MSFVYNVCGLTLRSSHPIPGLGITRTTTRLEVALVAGRVPERTPDVSAAPWHVSQSLMRDGRPPVVVWRDDDRTAYRFRYYDGVDIVVEEAGTRVWMTWPLSSDLEAASRHLLFSQLGFLLGLRGVTTLHGAAVAYGSGAVVFCGSPGSGKSTITVACARRGHPVVSDDLVAVRVCDDTFTVHPGYPFLSLRPDSLAVLQPGTTAHMPCGPVWDYLDDRYVTFDLQANGLPFQERPLPILAIYLLEPGDRGTSMVAIDPAHGSAMLLALLQRAAAVRVTMPAFQIQEFDLLAGLARRVPVRRLSWNPKLVSPDRLAASILHDTAGELAGAARQPLH